jgi:hypothetical protein
MAVLTNSKSMPATFLKNVFSRKDVSVFCFSLAIVIKILLFFYFQQTDNDKLFQAMAGKNLVEGHGLTIKQVLANNLSKESYERLVGWPPGYSVLFAIIYSLCKNVDVSCTIIDLICIVSFFILLQKLLRQLKFPDYLINVLVLFNGFAIKGYIEKSAPTDFLTLLLFVYNSYLTIKVFTQKNPVVPGILLVFFNVLPAWFRYLCIPVTFVIPGVLLWNGWLKKDRKYLLYGTCTMAMALLGVIALLSFQEPYVIPTERGIFWSNLLHVNPVLFSSFMNLKFILIQLSHFTGFSYITVELIFQRINIVPFVILLALLFYASLKRKWLAADPSQVFMTIGTLTGICIFSVLALLSLTHSAHFMLTERFFWTYVLEDRYFIILQFFIVILTAKWLFMNPAAVFPFKKWAQGLLLFLFTIEILHSAYYLAANFTYDKRNFTYIVTQNKMIQCIDNIIKKNNNTDVVVAGNNNMANRSVLMGGKGLFVPAALNEKEIYADKPTKLIAVVKRSQLPFYKSFLEKEGVLLEAQIGAFYFYSYNVKPNTVLKD